MALHKLLLSQCFAIKIKTTSTCKLQEAWTYLLQNYVHPTHKNNNNSFWIHYNLQSSCSWPQLLHENRVQSLAGPTTALVHALSLTSIQHNFEDLSILSWEEYSLPLLGRASKQASKQGNVIGMVLLHRKKYFFFLITGGIIVFAPFL